MPMSADTLTIAGSPVDLVAANTTLGALIPYAKGGVPELHFTRMIQALGALPDPWSGKPVTLQLGATGSTPIFAGDVVGYVDRYHDDIGWIREYRALGLAHRADFIPMTDSNTLTDTSIWNLPGIDPMFIPSRAGQTVGQIVAAILEMATNATPLNAAGIGAYTSMGPPTLPSATTSDLAGLTVIPPWVVRISGERLLLSLENFIQSCHPCFFLHVQPDGTIRFLDSRTFAANTLTMGADPRLGLPQLTRDYSDSYSQVEVRGNTLVRLAVLQTQPWPGSSAADGGLQEDFGYGTTSNAAAKAAWVPTDWSQPNAGIGPALSSGACTCPDTTHVTITTGLTLTTDQLAQGAGEWLGQLLLFADSLGGSISQLAQARVVANTATSGGSCTCTLDVALPATTYNSYQLFGLAAGENIVGRRYKVTNAAIASAMLNQAPYPMAYTYASGTAADMISSPMGVVMYNPSGGTSQPWNAVSLGITLDPVNGLIYFDEPTQVAAYGSNLPVQWAANVQAVVPVAVGTLTAHAPSSSTYAGTLYSVEGISRTKTITVLEWTDYSNDGNMAVFASEYLDSVKDVVVEGVVPYNGLLTGYLAPGQAVSIAGSGYATGWEGLALPVVSAEIAFQSGPAGTSYLTTLHLSNRRGRYSAENFLRPSITGIQLGGDEAIAAAGPQFFESATTAGQHAELEQREQQAEQQRQFREKFQSDPEFRRQAQQQQAAEAAKTPWDRAAEGLGAMYGGAAAGLDEAFGGAAAGLDALYGAAAGGDDGEAGRGAD